MSEAAGGGLLHFSLFVSLAVLLLVSLLIEFGKTDFGREGSRLKMPATDDPYICNFKTTKRTCKNMLYSLCSTFLVSLKVDVN